MSDTPMKSVTPNEEHQAFRKALENTLAVEGKDLDSADILAIVSNFVGQLIALQDQRTMTSEMVRVLVSQNIQRGNQEAIASLMDSKGSVQ